MQKFMISWWCCSNCRLTVTPPCDPGPTTEHNKFSIQCCGSKERKCILLQFNNNSILYRNNFNIILPHVPCNTENQLHRFQQPSSGYRADIHQLYSTSLTEAVSPTQRLYFLVSERMSITQSFEYNHYTSPLPIDAIQPIYEVNFVKYIDEHAMTTVIQNVYLWKRFHLMIVSKT